MLRRVIFSLVLLLAAAQAPPATADHAQSYLLSFVG